MNCDLTFLSEVQDELVLLRRQQMDVLRRRRFGPNTRQQHQTSTHHQHPESWERNAVPVRSESVSLSAGLQHRKSSRFIWTRYCTRVSLALSDSLQPLTLCVATAAPDPWPDHQPSPDLQSFINTAYMLIITSIKARCKYILKRKHGKLKLKLNGELKILIL